MKKLLITSAALAMVCGYFAQASRAELLTVSDANFSKDVLGSTTPVVVDFYADWCGPCRRMAPAFDHVSSLYGDKVKFVRVNVDDSPATAGKYGIASIPSFRIFQGGRLVGGTTGAVPEQDLCTTIDTALHKTAATPQTGF